MNVPAFGNRCVRFPFQTTPALVFPSPQSMVAVQGLAPLLYPIGSVIETPAGTLTTSSVQLSGSAALALLAPDPTVKNKQAKPTIM